MSDVLEIPLRPGDHAAHDRLRDILNSQAAADRMGRWRGLWTAVVAAASIPLSVFLFEGTPRSQVPRWSGALWATALLAAVCCGFIEWNVRRRLRALLAQARPADAR
jgi:hypothetical protein